VQYWLKMVGASTAPLPDDWLLGLQDGEDDRRDLLQRVRFPRNKRPSGVDAGDRLVYYAATARRYFAIVEVISDEPYPSAEDPRWPWALDVHPLLLVAHIPDAPRLEDLQLRKGNLSVRRGSHVRLTPEQYATAVRGLSAAATR
jgi:hypothetical protein